MIYSTPDNASHRSELRHSIYSSKTSTMRLAGELAAYAQVERRACIEDRRKLMLSLTEKGRALVEQTLPDQ